MLDEAGLEEGSMLNAERERRLPDEAGRQTLYAPPRRIPSKRTEKPQYLSRACQVTFEFVRADVLRNIYDRLIDKYGGVSGVRDENALESAIARPRNLQDYGEIESAGHLGAALAWALLRNYAFTDGNKRAAFAANATVKFARHR